MNSTVEVKFIDNINSYNCPTILINEKSVELRGYSYM